MMRRKVGCACILLVLLGMILSNSAVQIPPCVVSDLRIDASGYSEELLELKWRTTCSAATIFEIKWRPEGQTDWVSGMEIKGNETDLQVTELSSGVMYIFILRVAGERGVMMLTTHGETLSQHKATNLVAYTGNVSGSLHLQWTQASAGTSPPFRQQVLVQRVPSSVTSHFEYKWEVTEEGALLSSAVSTLYIASLMPYTRYLVRVDSLFADERAISPSRASLPARTPAGKNF